MALAGKIVTIPVNPDFRSLNLIDRRVPIHCSARSSVSLVKALEEMGFDVRRMRPGDEIVAGSCVTHDGEIRHEPTREAIEGSPERPA